MRSIELILADVLTVKNIVQSLEEVVQEAEKIGFPLHRYVGTVNRRIKGSDVFFSPPNENFIELDLKNLLLRRECGYESWWSSILQFPEKLLDIVSGERTWKYEDAKNRHAALFDEIALYDWPENIAPVTYDVQGIGCGSEYCCKAFGTVERIRYVFRNYQPDSGREQAR